MLKKINKDFIVKCIEFSINDFKKRYAGSLLGGVWAYIQTIVMVLIYWLVFEFGLKNGSVEGIPFLPWFISGLMPWLMFSDIINNSSNCMFEYNYIVKKIVFDIDIIPLSKTLVCLFVHSFFLLVCIAVTIGYGVFQGTYTMWVLYYFGALVMLVLPLTFALSTICVFLKDFPQIVSIVLNAAMWATPIVWNIDVVPESIKWIFKINPMYYIINGFRDALVYGGEYRSSILYTVFFWGVVVALWFACMKLYKKMVPHLADLL
ncbi:MAG: ABC transporter permease [Lachnospiraceae bacterium]|nr:ABC transporter permease [Lachnospiraceae bacterium]